MAIFGPWNYPYNCVFGPLIQSITAGNCVIIKPSEHAPKSSAAMKKFVDTYLDTDCIQVVEGGIDVASALS